MTLTLLDWAAIAGYLLLMLALGIYFRRRSGRNTEEYFVSGRQVAWWLAGTSMVATTFAADTPLVVTGLVYSQGIAGNWLWWSFSAVGNDDHISFCPSVETIQPADRRAVRGNALLGKTCRILARIPALFTSDCSSQIA